jgi:hypothetical protein|nr:MAG TPA: hypothetical protein [Caudoviricetes sp.]
MRKLSRNESIAIEFAHGASVASLADAHGLHTSRIHQIFVQVCNRYHVNCVRAANDLGRAIMNSQLHHIDYSTPEGFYFEVEAERNRDWLYTHPNF